jgi:hypothetical protein
MPVRLLYLIALALFGKGKAEHFSGLAGDPTLARAV